MENKLSALFTFGDIQFILIDSAILNNPTPRWQQCIKIFFKRVEHRHFRHPAFRLRVQKANVVDIDIHWKSGVPIENESHKRLISIIALKSQQESFRQSGAKIVSHRHRLIPPSPFDLDARTIPTKIERIVRPANVRFQLVPGDIVEQVIAPYF